MKKGVLKKTNIIYTLFKELLKLYGNQNWWPVITRNPTFEVCIGAILTQNTSWKNVEKAIINLYKENLVDEKRLSKADLGKIQELIKPSRYYKQKSFYIKEFAKFYIENKEKIKEIGLKEARELLLNQKGIGKETADTILLYAFERPSFPIDAYTMRLFSRLGIIKEKEKNYETLKGAIEKSIKNVSDLKEFHALIVKHCKDVCKRKPKCNICKLKICPLRSLK